MTEERLLAIEEIKISKRATFAAWIRRAGFEAVFAPGATADFTREGGYRSRSFTRGAANVANLIKALVAPALTIHHGAHA